MPLNTVFFHCDVKGPPYQVLDFHSSFAGLGLLKDIEACGPFQMNHVLIVTLKSLAAKHRLLKGGEFRSKGKKCLVLDPC